MATEQYRRLADLACDVSYGFTASANANPVGPKFLRITDIQNGVVNWQSVPYCEITQNKLDKYLLSYGDIVVARTGNSTGENYIYKGSEPTVFASYLIRFRINQKIADPFFVWYQMRSADWWNFVASSKTGSAQAGANAQVLGQYTLRIPPLCEQKAIAHILGTFDNKIEINRKMNETLEGITQTIFKSWFIDFDPVKAKSEGRNPDGMSDEIATLFPDSFEDSELGRIPKGWKVGKLRDIVHMGESTINPSKFPDESFNLYSIPAFDSGKMPSRALGSTIKSNKLILPSGAILVSKLNPITPRVWQIFDNFPGRSISSTEFVAFLPKQNNMCSFLYWNLKSESCRTKMIGAVTGTSGSHQRVRKNDILDLDTISPTSSVYSLFHSTVNSLIKRISGNILENRQLVEIRDNLLPKLISGEIRIKDADKLVSKII